MSGEPPAPLIQALLAPSVYPHPVDRVELVETHISWVLLTGRFAYKVKKPVNLGFLDFSTLEKRRHACREELRLNRRLAPDLYLGLVGITGSTAVPVLRDEPEPGTESGPERETAFEYAVKMREFPQQAQLDRLLDSGSHVGAALDGLFADAAACVAEFHARVPASDENDLYGTPLAVLRPVLENFAQTEARVRDGDDVATLARLRDWTETTHAELAPRMAGRKRAGFVRECHGDLHLSNMLVLAGRVVPFDCLEFDPALRWIDVMSDIAFLVMDLEVRGRADLAFRFLDAYLARTGDYDGLGLLRYYTLYRTLVRAKVAAIRRAQSGSAAAADRLRRHLEYGLGLVEPARPALIVTHGFSGSGKSWLSDRLVPVLPALRVRSDVERKRLFGLRADEASGSDLDEGIYTPEADERTYVRLADAAKAAIRAGYTVIVDAAFLRRSERVRFRGVAAMLGVPFRILDCEANPGVLRERVGQRAEEGADASEASLAVLERQLASAEPLDDGERSAAVSVDTSQAPDVAAVRKRMTSGL